MLWCIHILVNHLSLAGGEVATVAAIVISDSQIQTIFMQAAHLRTT